MGSTTESKVLIESPDCGVPALSPLIPVAGWHVGNFTVPITVTTSNAIHYVSAGGSNQIPALRFGAAATTTDLARVPFQLSPTFAKHSPHTGSFKKRKGVLILAARTVDLTGSAPANLNLALTALATYTPPVINTESGAQSASLAFFSSTAATGYELGKATTDESAVVGYADSAANVVTGVRLYVFDIFKGLTEAQLQSLSPFTLASLTISVSETVGTNLAVEVYAGWVGFDEHLSVHKFLKKMLGK